MKTLIGSSLLALGMIGALMVALIGAASAQQTWEEQHEWSEFPQAQAEAYEAGKAGRTLPTTQQEILFCKAHWEGYSEAMYEQGAEDMFGTMTEDYVYASIDYWSARLEISDYDAEKEIADAAYYALLYFGPSADDRLEATRKLGACAPAD